MSEQDAFSAMLDWADAEEFDINVALAAFVEEEHLIPAYRTLNITEEVAEAFSGIVRSVLSKKQSSWKGADLELIPYSPDFKPDQHQVVFVEVEGSELEALLTAVPSSANIPLLDLEEGFVEHLKFYGIILEADAERLVLFRTYNPNKELTRSKKLHLRWTGEIYGSLKEPTFQFDHNFDAILSEGYLFVLNQHNTQSMFQFYEALRNVADKTLQAIEEQIPIANFEEFRESSLNQLQKLAKLRNIAAKPYLKNVTMKDIKQVIEKYNLDIQITVEHGQERLVFDSRNRWAILKLLDDAYLESVMTGQEYEVNSKRQL